jgi:UDP-N-acetylmuramoyl-tripeptide--D-alanyl-D-alanine ligase
MELGEQSIKEHKTLVQLIQQYEWKQVILVGGDFKNIQHPFSYFNDSTEAKAWYNRQHFENSSFLIKGSRSMQMEKILSQ